VSFVIHLVMDFEGTTRWRCCGAVLAQMVMATASGLTEHSKMKVELGPIHAAKWDRIIPCHGDVIETGGRAAWDKIWAKFA
jgi:hypothetical protein